jgi:hypothetical protein
MHYSQTSQHNFKRIVFWLMLITLLAYQNSVIAQIPQRFNYQSVVRDLSGNILPNHTLGIQFTILSGSETGISVYSERHVVTSQNSGLITLTIGDGTVISGTMADIDWSLGSFYLSISVDYNNTGAFTALGISPLLTVPYAMYSQKAGALDGADGLPIANPQKGDIIYYNGTKWKALPIGTKRQQLVVIDDVPVWETKHHVGEFYGGGIIYFVWEEEGIQHGLIAALADLPSTAPDADLDGVPDGFMIAPNLGTDTNPVFDQIANTKSHFKGLQNTNNIASYQDGIGLTGYAAQVCKQYNGGGYTDWYLPSIHELSTLYRNLLLVNPVLEDDNNPDTQIVIGNYWASTIFNTTQGWAWAMARGYGSNNNLNTYRYVRAIRRY